MDNLYWALPALLLSAFIIGWAAETAEIYISQGLALAVLAWLQVMPEFAVEATIAFQQKQTLMIANLTGSLRLLVGLGWPMVYFAYVISGKSRAVIKIPNKNALEVFILLISTFYFGFVAIKGSLTVGDSAFLILFYAIYLRRLFKGAKGHNDGAGGHELPWIGKRILAFKDPRVRVTGIILLFVIGGVMLYTSAGPFLDGLEKLSVTLGISTFVFVQWVAPFVSEFPEKITAFNWARKESKAPMAFMNLVSSNIVQWTLLAAMIPIVFSISKHAVTPIFFDKFQTEEILLTVVQSFFSILIMMDMQFGFIDALLIFTLWLIQFCFPALRWEIIYAYLFFSLLEIGKLIYLGRQGKLVFALKILREQIKSK